MKAPRVLEALARRYERAQAGRTGEASRDLLMDAEDVLRDADSAEGELRALAEQHLAEAQRIGILTLEPLHKRDRKSLGQIRFSPVNEARLYEWLRRSSPAQLRAALARQFGDAASAGVPENWDVAWRSFCERRRDAALCGGAIAPFDRTDLAANAELLALLPKLLQWGSEPDDERRTSLVRFASCVLLSNSKRLEELAAQESGGELRDRLRGKLGRLLEEITGGVVRTLDDLGIIPNPRSVLAHGPLRLKLDGEWFDLGRLHGAFRLSQADLDRAEHVETSARRCLTVENETSFHELAKLRSGVLLIQTSFPGSATIALLKGLPPTLEFHHFGDSDEAGFEIFCNLRKRSGCDFQALHMERGRPNFEQESLGRPKAEWPFY